MKVVACALVLLSIRTPVPTTSVTEYSVPYYCIIIVRIEIKFLTRQSHHLIHSARGVPSVAPVGRLVSQPYVATGSY